MNERLGFLAALQEGTVAERRITRRIFADWLMDHGDRAEADRQRILGEEPYRNALVMEFVHLPPGTFWMGGENGICGTRQVTIEHDFYIGIYPVTQGEWTEVMGSNPSYFQKGKGGADKIAGVSHADLKRFPVETVSWNDCQTFLNRLNEKCNEDGWVYRLPTEAEWEYSCRGGATSQADCAWNYYFQTPTNTLTPKLANFSESKLKRPTKVGLYPANALGIYDMHANVWEWCQNLHSNGTYRIRRGGSWVNSAGYCRAAYWDRYGPSSSNRYLGLRVARVSMG